MITGYFNRHVVATAT